MEKFVFEGELFDRDYDNFEILEGDSLIDCLENIVGRRVRITVEVL
jgi:hypothetical protein